MIATFAFDKNSSPINAMADAIIVRHKPAQYMSMCQFNNIYWEFNRAHNYAPGLVFEGEVERLDAMDTKFPGNVDTVYFTENKPTVRFVYSLNEEQLSELAKKGFWSEDGVNIPSLFSTAKFQLETYAVVEEIVNEREDKSIPVFNIELVKPYENAFDATAYELIEKITRCKPDESKVIENTVSADVQQGITDELEAAKASMLESERTVQQTADRPLTSEELDIQSKSYNIREAVGAERAIFKSIRAAGNARAEAERAAEHKRLMDEQSVPTKPVTEAQSESVKPVEPEKPKPVVDNESNVYESNDAIFDSIKDSDTPMPDKVAEFMKRLSSTGSMSAESVQKKDDKRDTGSSTASGVKGLGVYTFEDQSTAQFEMRVDEGKGNEKLVDESVEEKSNDTKSDTIDPNAQRTKFDVAATNVVMTNNAKADSKDDMSK